MNQTAHVRLNRTTCMQRLDTTMQDDVVSLRSPDVESVQKSTKFALQLILRSPKRRPRRSSHVRDSVVGQRSSVGQTSSSSSAKD
mmetsp:Transcript_86/g.262  ORF Transcript_86/g.262 Transcript_86/m.262 type:complete len:85 (+) Transcript_86:328-582(+)